MDPETLMQAFDLSDAPAEVEAEDEAIEVDESDLDADIEAAFNPGAPPEDRREAFIRAVKAAMKG